MDIKPNFFTGTRSLPEIQFANDPEFRVSFGRWLFENYEALVEEYRTHGRFLTLAEINQD